MLVLYFKSGIYKHLYRIKNYFFKSNVKINNGKKENKMKTIELTKADFLKKIVDYEKNPEEAGRYMPVLRQ